MISWIETNATASTANKRWWAQFRDLEYEFWQVSKLLLSKLVKLGAATAGLDPALQILCSFRICRATLYSKEVLLRPDR